MRKQCNSSFDRLTELPSSVSQIILMCLPLRNMARTCVLSKHWRYQWVNVPQLVFKDDPMYLVSREERYRYNAMKVLDILFQRHGSLLKLTLDMTAWLDCSAIHRIIPYLSRNGIKELTLLMPKGECYTLPSSILSCAGLRTLSLTRCVFQPLTTIVGFSNLVSLELVDVTLDPNLFISSCPLLECLVLGGIVNTVNVFSIDAPNLKTLYVLGHVSQLGVMNTPHLTNLCLLCARESFSGNSSFDLISFLHSLTLLAVLTLSTRFLQVLARRDSPNDLLKSLNRLVTLELLLVHSCHIDELSSTLWFIRSSPSLQKLKFRLYGPVLLSLTEVELYLKMQERSNYSLLNLQVVEIVLVKASCDLGILMELSKFLLDVSPKLETLYIKPDVKCIGVDGYKRLVELACYPRASPKAKIVFGGLESLNLSIA